MRLLPRWKLRLWGLMLLIAGFALCMGAVVAVNRYRVCMERASFYRSQARSYRHRSKIHKSWLERAGKKTAASSQLETWIEEDQDAARRCEEIGQQFERSACFLLFPIPAEPEDLRESVHTLSG